MNSNQIVYRNGKVSEIRVQYENSMACSGTTYFKKKSEFYIQSHKLNNVIKVRLIQLPSMIQRIFVANTTRGVEKLKQTCSRKVLNKKSIFNISSINDFTEVQVA